MTALVIGQSITYATSESIPITDIVYALMGLERILQRTPDILEMLAPGYHISRTEVALADLQATGLSAKLQVKYHFGSRQLCDSFAAAIGQRDAAADRRSPEKLLSVIVAALLLNGGAAMLRREGGDYRKVRAAAERAENALARMTGIPNPQSVFIPTVRNDVVLPSDAMSVIKPARQAARAEIRLGDFPEAVIGAGIIRTIYPLTGAGSGGVPFTLKRGGGLSSPVGAGYSAHKKGESVPGFAPW